MTSNYVSRGPKLNPTVERYDTDLTASLRILSFYQIHTDQVETRFDVLVNNDPNEGREGFLIGMKGDQLCAGLVSTSPGTCALMVPKGGIIDSFAIKAHPQDLIGVLRGLADELEKVYQ